MDSFTDSEIQPVDTPTMHKDPTESFSPSKVRSDTAIPLGDQPEQDKRKEADLQTYNRLLLEYRQAVFQQVYAKASTSASIQEKQSDYTNAITTQHKYERISTMLGANVKQLSMIPPNKADYDIDDQISKARQKWGIALEKVKKSTAHTNRARENFKRTEEELKHFEESIRENLKRIQEELKHFEESIREKNCSTSAVVVENLTSACKSFVGAVNMCATWFTKKLAPKCKEFYFTETASEMESDADMDEQWSIIDAASEL